MAIDYSKMTTEEFDEILIDMVGEINPSELMQIPGIYEILAEHYNNEVLEAWEHEHLAVCSLCGESVEKDSICEDCENCEDCCECDQDEETEE